VQACQQQGGERDQRQCDEAGDVVLEVGDAGAFHVCAKVVQGGSIEAIT